METVSSILKEFEGYGGLGINWMMYGSGGQRIKKDGLVIERFKDHENDFNKDTCIKTIVNPRYTLSVCHVHYAAYVIRKFCVNTDKKKIESTPYSYGVFNKLRINHYFTKSYEEFLRKRQRGKADFIDDKRPFSDFYDHDRNQEKNDPIMNKYIPIIYRNIAERYKK
ncbi:MAG: hypothetical protein LBG79_03550 [Spirochaetaceae bacterium]|jgi:hypothetical protein|nr:hypothetical protein [Spirochaetaceae bacterium]